jgi:hypothetical protein
LGAWRLTVGAHEQKLNTKKYAAALSFPNVYLLYNTVVLTGRDGSIPSLGTTQPLRS